MNRRALGGGGAVAALLFALVLVLPVLPAPTAWTVPIGSPVSERASPVPGQTVGQDPALLAALREQVAQLHLAPDLARRVVDGVAAESVDTVLQRAGVSPTGTISGCGPFPFTCPGTVAVGILLGPLALAESLIINNLIGGISISCTSCNYRAWTQAEMSALGNYENLTGTMYGNLASALNFSSIGFQRMADAAAVLQLNRSTFSVPLDLLQSGLAAQMGEILWGYQRQVASSIVPAGQWVNAQSAPGAPYASNCLGLQLSNTGPTGSTTYQYTAGAANGFTGYLLGPVVGSAANGGGQTFDVYTPAGANLTVVGTAANTVTITAQSYANPKLWWNNSVTMPSGSGIQYVTLGAPLSAAAWNMSISSNGGAGGYLFLNGGIRIASGTATPAGSLGVVTQFAAGSQACSGGTGASNWYWSAPSTLGMVCLNTCPQGNTPTASYAIFAGASGTGLATWLGNLEWQAAANGNAYWSFLRSLGYTSVSQVPSNCIIPAPYQALPSNLNLGSLSAQQLESLYRVWLQGLGSAFNVSLQGTQFCGNSKNTFNLGNVTWGNWGISATGYIFIANSSGTFDYRGKPLASEKFANLTTWAIQATQMVVMPTLAQVNIPVGIRWAVPTTNPIWVYVYDTVGYCPPTNNTPQCTGMTAQLLQLSGNGTGTGSCPANGYFCAQGARTAVAVPAGSSIYLTSCTIQGTATRNCTIGPQNVTVTVQQLTCTGAASACKQQNATAGFSFGNPFAALACLLLALFGGCGSGIGQELAAVIGFLLMFLVIALGAYAIFVVLSGVRSRRGGGGGGAPAARGSGSSRGVARLPFTSVGNPGTARRLRNVRGAVGHYLLMMLGGVVLAAGVLNMAANGLVNWTPVELMVIGMVLFFAGLVIELLWVEKRHSK